MRPIGNSLGYSDHVIDTQLDHICREFGAATQADIVGVRLAGLPSDVFAALCDPFAADDVIPHLTAQMDVWCSADQKVCDECIIMRGTDGRIYGLFPLARDGHVIGVLAAAVPEAKAKVLRNSALVSAFVSLVMTSVTQTLTTHQLESDVQSLSARANALARKCQIDHLTQLENKASFEELCTARLTNDRRPAAMLAIDLDDFKQVNDIYGHRFGDQYLKIIATALSTALPGKAIVGRTGGDEFCVLIEIPEAGKSYLKSVTHQIRHCVQRSVATLGKPNLGGMSIGISLFPSQANTFEDLHGLADCALYASKRHDRNTNTIYHPDLAGLIEPANIRDGRSTFSFDLLQAHLQPIIDIDTGQRQGFELLARMQDGKGNLCQPGSFAWMFRDHRFGSTLTTHIVDSALEQICVELGMPPETLPELWVNVTDSDLLCADFVFDLQSVLERYRVGWDKIVIEVNEETMIGPRKGLVFNALNEISRRGGRIALDDFGAGHIGLAHACHWPIDIIKIDLGVIQQLQHNMRSVVCVEAIAMVAEKLGQQVLAEGIETAEQLALARSFGCTLAQGFHFARPMKAADALGDTCMLEAS